MNPRPLKSRFPKTFPFDLKLLESIQLNRISNFDVNFFDLKDLPNSFPCQQQLCLMTDLDIFRSELKPSWLQSQERERKNIFQFGSFSLIFLKETKSEIISWHHFATKIKTKQEHLLKEILPGLLFYLHY